MTTSATTPAPTTLDAERRACPRTNVDRAKHHVNTVHRLRGELEREYLRDNPRRSVVSDLHASIGVNLKLASVHAELANHDALNDVVHALELLRGTLAGGAS